MLNNSTDPFALAGVLPTSPLNGEHFVVARAVRRNGRLLTNTSPERIAEMHAAGHVFPTGALAKAHADQLTEDQKVENARILTVWEADIQAELFDHSDSDCLPVLKPATKHYLFVPVQLKLYARRVAPLSLQPAA